MPLTLGCAANSRFRTGGQCNVFVQVPFSLGFQRCYTCMKCRKLAFATHPTNQHQALLKTHSSRAFGYMRHKTRDGAGEVTSASSPKPASCFCCSPVISIRYPGGSEFAIASDRSNRIWQFPFLVLAGGTVVFSMSLGSDSGLALVN